MVVVLAVTVNLAQWKVPKTESKHFLMVREQDTEL